MVDLFLLRKSVGVGSVGVFVLSFFNSNQGQASVDLVIPILYLQAVVGLWGKNFPAFLLCVNSNLIHLLVELNNHQA